MTLISDYLAIKTSLNIETEMSGQREMWIDDRPLGCLSALRAGMRHEA